MARDGEASPVSEKDMRGNHSSSEAESDGYGTGQEEVEESAPPTPGAQRKSLSGMQAGESVTWMSHPSTTRMRFHVDQQQDIPWNMRRYEIYQPPAFVARAPPRYYNFHLLSASAKERIQRELSQSYNQRLPSLVSSGSVFSGVGSGTAGGSVRSSLSVRRPSMLASAHFGSAGAAGLETITASPASTAAPLNSPSLDPMSALNAGPAANHRLSTWLKRPPASPRTSMQPIPADATDLMDGTDPFGGAWHHSSPYDAGEMVVGRRTRDSSMQDGSPHTRSMAGPSTRKGPSPLSQSTSAINLTDTEPPLPDPPGSPDLLSGTRTKRKLSKRRSTSASRGGLTSLFTRKSSIDEDHTEARTSGLRGRSRPPLSPSSQSLAQTQGIVFPTDGGEKRPRRKLSKRRSRSSSVASVDSSRSVETPIHTQFSKGPRDVEIIELPSAKHQSPQPRPPSQRPPSQRPQSFQHHRPPSSHQHSAPDPPICTSPTQGPAPPSTTTNKRRERKISAASINSFLSRITSRDKDKDPPRSESVQDHRKVPPHKLLNHVGKDKSGNMFSRFARKLSLIRRRSIDVMANPDHNSSRPSFTVERRPATANSGAGLQRRATLDMAPSRSTTYRETIRPDPAPAPAPAPAFSPPPPPPSDLFSPIDPQLRSSRLINTQLSPPPRIPDLIQGDRNSWAASLHRKVSTKSPAITTDELAPPPPIGGKHPDSPHSIPKWGITTEKTGGPLLLENGSPTEESPVSSSKGVLTCMNPDSEAESVGKEVAVYGRDVPPVPDLKALRAQFEETQPLVVRRPSPTPPPESPLKRGGSPVKRRESPVKRGKRDQSPVKPVRRTEPLKDHSAVNGADVQKSHGFRPVGISSRLSGAMGSTTSVDAIQGDDEELGKPEDTTGRQRILRSRASTDSISKMHVITPKTSLQKIRARVVSNPPPVEISKESSPVKEDPPAPIPERKSSKARPKSGYTGADSRHSIYGTATSESSEVLTSPAGPRKRISTVAPDVPRHGHSHSRSLDTSSSKLADVKGTATPYMTPTADHAPLHPFSEKPIEYQNMPISVMRFETTSPPPAVFSKSDDVGPSKFADSKGAWIDSPVASPPPKAPYINDEFSVSKEKLAAQGEFKKHHKRESTAESERRRAKDEAKEERARARAEWERAERERLERVERDRQERERARIERAERLERERREQERVERERLERIEQELREQERREQERRELERLEQERQERERIERERQERREQERLERERREQERAERERVRAAQRQREEQERIERIARERDLERVERERIERELLELERERMERERRLEWERLERERLMEEEMRRREPPALLPSNSGRRTRHEAEVEREVVITTKEPRKSRRRSPNESRSTSPTSTAPPPPPKENLPLKARQRAHTDAYAPLIASALPPPVQPSMEVIAGVPVLPEGTHVEVAQPFHPRPTSVNTIEAPSLKAREAWERDRLDKGQSVLVPTMQRAVIPDIGSPRPAPDPRQRQASGKGRLQTPLVSHSEPVVPPLSEYGPSHSSYSIPTYPPSRAHNPLPMPPTIDGPFPLHRPGPAYTNPNRQRPSRPSGSRNPLPEPPRVSSYPLHHNVSPPRGLPPGAVR